jgi:hypothetical protein
MSKVLQKELLLREIKGYNSQKNQPPKNENMLEAGDLIHNLFI